MAAEQAMIDDSGTVNRSVDDTQSYVSCISSIFNLLFDFLLVFSSLNQISFYRKCRIYYDTCHISGHHRVQAICIDRYCRIGAHSNKKRRRL
jgi:hypothetical protein